MNASTTTFRKGWCGPCHQRCGVRVYQEHGQPVRITGDPHNPMSLGLQCARGKLLLDHHLHPNRLNYPLKRKGPRGSGRWKRISWRQALHEIGAELARLRDQYGAETLAFSHGTYRSYGWPVKRFMNAFGSPNLFGAINVCRCPHWMVEWMTYGANFLSVNTNTRCIVLWGRNSSETSPQEWLFIQAARKQRKAKLLVIDPRTTKEAAQADLHLAIRPGTDLALMLAWLRLLITEQRYDRDFVDQWTVGFAELKAHLALYTPSWAAKQTGLQEAQIVAGARFFAAHQPAVIPWGFGLEKSGVNAVQTARAHCLLQAIMGNLDVKGGELLGRGETEVIADYVMEANQLLTTAQRAKQLGSNQHRLQAYPAWERVVRAWEQSGCRYTLPPAAQESACASSHAVLQALLTGKPYPVTALICQASNPMLHLPDPEQTARALQSNRLQLSVVMEYYLTPTAMLADYVLPAADTLERDDIHDMHSYGFWIAANPAALPPRQERRSDYWFWRQLGLRLGQEALWPWPEMREALDYRLAPAGLTFLQLVQQDLLLSRQSFGKFRDQGFATPSGKVELYSSIFHELGYPPLPVYRQPQRVAHGHRTFPYHLITGIRRQPYYHSEYRQLDRAREQHPEPLAWLHPQLAATEGLKEGDLITLSTRHGQIYQRVYLSETIRPDCIAIEHGWWFPEQLAALPALGGAFTANANQLCTTSPETLSPEMGTFQLSGIPCRIDPVPILAECPSSREDMLVTTLAEES